MHFPFPPDTVHFNPRFREGSDFVCRGKSGGLGDFNPRSREGSDKNRQLPLSRIIDFNPRSREGSDFVTIITATRVPFISIHAPAKGATS